MRPWVPYMTFVWWAWDPAFCQMLTFLPSQDIPSQLTNGLISLTSWHQVLVWKREFFVINHSENSACQRKGRVRKLLALAHSDIIMDTCACVRGPSNYKGSLPCHLNTELQMPIYPLKSLSAVRKSFPFLLKMPDQDCCTNVRSSWPKANSSNRYWRNWRRKKKTGGNMGVKEAILILFKRALETPSEPCLCYSILTWADTCHSSLTSGQLFCSDFCPTSLSSLCPRLWTPLKAGPG